MTSIASRGSRIVVAITFILALVEATLIFGGGSVSAAVDETYYFNGSPEDEANKHATMPTATFSKEAPTATTPITQTTKFFCNSEVHFNIHCANWVGAYSGNITGPMEFCSYWSSANAADVQAGSADVELTLFDGATQISRVTATVNIGTPDEPAVSSVIVNVEGSVASGELAVTARPEAAGQALVMHYGATTTPSFFGPPGKLCGAEGSSPTSSSSPTGSPSPGPSPTGTKPTTAGARIKFSDLTPKKGEATVATASLKKCSGHAATKIQLQRKQGAKFKKVAVKKLSASCKAKFRFRANFDKATFRSFWPKQDQDHKASKSRPKTVTTH